MKAFKHMTAFVLALVIAAALAVTAYAASVTVKYRVYVYSDEITFRQYRQIHLSVFAGAAHHAGGIPAADTPPHGEHRKSHRRV